MSQTRIFVSSTCYDLIHVRQALRQHITELGHVPVMSEFSDFRVDPGLNNLENCRNNVRNNADIFVLIVGGRRGSVDSEANKSIVNLEYEAAVREGLDIYVFIDHNVLNLLPVWKRNKQALLEPTVDSNEVLEFIDRIRQEQRWTHSFLTESDISTALALQLSGQLRHLLLKNRSGHMDFLRLFSNESTAALSLVQARNDSWEFLLSAELFEARLKRCRKKYEDIRHGRVLGPHRNLTYEAYVDWLIAKSPEISCAIDKIKFTATEELRASWGPPGTPGDPKAILETADELEKAVGALIEMESDAYRTHGPDVTNRVRDAFIGLTEEVFSAVETLPARLREAVERAHTQKERGENRPITIDLAFTLNKGDELIVAIDSMRAAMAEKSLELY